MQLTRNEVMRDPVQMRYGREILPQRYGPFAITLSVKQIQGRALALAAFLQEDAQDPCR